MNLWVKPVCMYHADTSSGQLGEGYRAVPDLLCILSRSITQACRTAKRLHQGEQSDAAASPTVHHSDDSDDAHISENMFWTWYHIMTNSFTIWCTANIEDFYFYFLPNHYASTVKIDVSFSLFDRWNWGGQENGIMILCKSFLDRKWSCAAVVRTQTLAHGEPAPSGKQIKF